MTLWAISCATFFGAATCMRWDAGWVRGVWAAPAIFWTLVAITGTSQ